MPYREQHVARYHEWMKDEWLQEMTASEPLTIEEEYEMQRSWYADPDKCTFILIDRRERGSFPPSDADVVTGQERSITLRRPLFDCLSQACVGTSIYFLMWIIRVRSAK